MSTKNAAIATDTLATLERGWYELPQGGRIEIASDLERSRSATRLYDPDELGRLTAATVAAASPRHITAIEVRNETTLEATARLAATDSDPIACLNFASARNPGGGFLGGAQAQEESLARSSGLYPTLMAHPAFYEAHRRNNDLLYSDRIIYSPEVPVFKTDCGALLERPYRVAFITSPAPNRGAIARNQPASLERVAETLRRRSAKILAVALEHGHERIVLGAWGCGVFRNDPWQVAEVFAEHLGAGGGFFARFRCVSFAVFDASAGTPIFKAFRAIFNQGKDPS